MAVKLAHAGRRPEWILAVGILDFSLEQAVIAPALPVVARQYEASPSDVVWLITAFLLSAAVATPLAGRLGDQYGRRRLLLWSVGAFVAGSFVCAVGGSLGVIIGGRAVQGLGAGTAPLALALVRDHVEPERVSRAVGVLVGAAGAGSVLGLLGGSLLVDAGSLPALFWGLTAVAALTFAAVALVVPESPVRASTRVDWPGGALLGVGLVPLLLAISQGNDWGWGSARVLALWAAAAAGLGGFALRQRAARAPLFDPRLLARRPVWSAQVLTFAAGFVAFSHLAALPLLAGLPESTGYGLGLTTTQIGVVFVPSSMAALISGPLAGKLAPRVGTRGLVVAGLLFIALGDAILATFTVSELTIVLAGLPLGLAFGLTFGITLDLVLANAGGQESGAALGLTNEVRTVGSAVGATVAAAILVAAGEVAPGVPVASGFDTVFGTFAVASVLAVALVPLLPPGGPVHVRRDSGRR
jgi:MFS family permease